MDDKIHKIERELALLSLTQKSMSESLQKISITLERTNEVRSDQRLLNEKLHSMDKEVHESFKRNHSRIDRLETIISKLSWLVITPIVLALIGTYLMGGIN